MSFWATDQRLSSKEPLSAETPQLDKDREETSNQ